MVPIQILYRQGSCAPDLSSLSRAGDVFTTVPPCPVHWPWGSIARMIMRYAPPPHTGLDICYLDNDLIVLNKPSGLLSVPGRGEGKQDCLASRVQREFPETLVVHRLDLGTSGLVLMARNREMQGRLGHLFQRRLVRKRYVAVVAGRPQPQEGEIDLPLIADWPNRPRQRVDHQAGKQAITRFQVLTEDGAAGTSRVRLLPQTGRTHQLRVHMMSIGHPIVGDELYAGDYWHAASERLLLHAERLSLQHPRTGRELQIERAADF